VRASVAGREAELTARLTVSARPGGAWRLALGEARLHGFVPIPAPLLLAALPAAVGLGEGGGHWAMRPPALLHGRGLTEWDLSLCELVLVARLVETGWRLPARDGLESRPLEVADGRLRFTLGAPDQEGAGEGEQDVDGHGEHGGERVAEVAERGLAALAEAAFSAGELRPAAEGFRRALAAEPDSAFARERLFQLLASFPDGLRELEGLCDGVLAEQPELALALTGKAVAAAEGGRPEEAATIYARLAVSAHAAGEPLEEAAAQMAAAEQLQRAGDAAAASIALERVLALRPEHEVAARLLAGGQGAA
jgi:tetratricopeptide (TPR) repeat protein